MNISEADQVVQMLKEQVMNGYRCECVQFPYSDWANLGRKNQGTSLQLPLQLRKRQCIRSCVLKVVLSAGDSIAERGLSCKGYSAC